MKSIGKDGIARIVKYLILKTLRKIKQCFYLNKGDNNVIDKKSEGKTDCLVSVKPGIHSNKDGIKK
jgi:hypothetical protein